jgi:hypothetical protein
MHAGTGRVKQAVPGAGRIRCLRERRFKFARHFHTERERLRAKPAALEGRLARPVAD